ncbi:helix-turn-helix domain-containing protein [Cryptosporangium arvum]|uniref:DNA-binding domain-containing protein, AraC-type n=1 Tax=Cryptosporangium arvum DSM 44712 TaxID=927661 RepID=A0A010YS10_9ACTN|nr:helix-turn-helix domain-containing protein [Cryptosporangium arvum]EXG83005.1 DNA-binding domain-containing protein, AraC-type [Cryptosporangium arvum DSM 44712]
MLEVYDTASLARHDRAEAIATRMREAAHAAVWEQPETGHEAELRLESCALGPLRLLNTRTSPHRAFRTRRHARGSSGAPVIALGVTLRGEGSQTQSGTEVPSVRNALYLLEMSAPFEHQRRTTTWAYTLHVPGDQLGLPLEAVHRARGALASSPLYRLMSRHLRELFRNQTALAADPAAARLGVATIELVRALVASAAHDRRHARSALDVVFLERVRFFVETHLADPDLTPAAIAAAHHVSERQLYKVCAAAGIRLEQWIIRRRLERVRDELADPAARHRTIAAVAYRWGFVNRTHFAQRFRAEYGLTAREWRALNS